MRTYVIILTSITYVHKVKDILSRNNIQSRVVKLQASYERRGCGYGLELSENYVPYTVALIERQGIRIVEIQLADEYYY